MKSLVRPIGQWMVSRCLDDRRKPSGLLAWWLRHDDQLAQFARRSRQLDAALGGRALADDTPVSQSLRLARGDENANPCDVAGLGLRGLHIGDWLGQTGLGAVAALVAIATAMWLFTPDLGNRNNLADHRTGPQAAEQLASIGQSATQITTTWQQTLTASQSWSTASNWPGKLTQAAAKVQTTASAVSVPIDQTALATVRQIEDGVRLLMIDWPSRLPKVNAPAKTGQQG